MVAAGSSLAATALDGPMATQFCEATSTLRTRGIKQWICLLQGALWQRKGWKEMDKMRAQLEDLRELRDLVRSLGRGGGWGPLRRAPVQYLDMKGRPGLLRTILEQQETRGLTRSDDISRLLPSEVHSRHDIHALLAMCNV